MGLYHKEFFTLVVRIATPGREDAGLIPQSRSGSKYFPIAHTQLGRTRVSGLPMGPRMLGLARRMGPACQVEPTGGTRVLGWSDEWDPCIRSAHGTHMTGPTMGPMCQVCLWDPHVRLAQ
jgi:hypothetical protein